MFHDNVSQILTNRETQQYSQVTFFRPSELKMVYSKNVEKYRKAVEMILISSDILTDLSNGVKFVLNFSESGKLHKEVQKRPSEWFEVLTVFERMSGKSAMSSRGFLSSKRPSEWFEVS